MKANNSEYILNNYGKKSNFASFLPGIAGVNGIPIWCYYVNRGQAVTCFGVEDKDHAIMEFYPAHMAYQNVKRTGFRTFLKVNGTYVEAFHDEANRHSMKVGMNTLTIFDELEKEKINVKVDYFVLPNESVGALVRKVEIINNSDKPAEIELLDGMPQVIPYGVNMDFMKNMVQTAKAWMQVEDEESGVPYYRVRASIIDTADVAIVEGGNFAVATLGDGKRLKAIVDPEVVFGYDNSLERPVEFVEGGLERVNSLKQNTSNLLPCAFFEAKANLEANESITVYELIGQTECKAELSSFMKKELTANYFEGKEEVARKLVDDLTLDIETETGDKRFDAYCRYTYMDNLLRGGYPVQLGNNKIFYVYSRKHGDLERDYNYFSMAAEFFSQGNGNFRDINQNRRMDVFFSPFVGRENIKMFYSLLQLDGYNPLAIEKITYLADREEAKVVTENDAILDFISKPFTPGALYKKLLSESEKNGEYDVHAIQKVFNSLIDISKAEANGNFGEGYWSDHWDYNMDLIDEYVSLYPECEKDMLFEKEYKYFLSQININPRHKRYAVTPNGVRQYNALNKESARKTTDKFVKADYQQKETVYSSLIEKLILLSSCKFAALDPEMMGIEMEGGKPGWYDALNGMPAMFGSSMAETYELARMLEYVIKVLDKYPAEIDILSEVADYIAALDKINKEYINASNRDSEDAKLLFWNKINDVKEAYREQVYKGISGNRETMSSEVVGDILKGFYQTVRDGIDRANVDGVCPTYFTYDVLEYEQDENGIYPKKFAQREVPLFLEGPVRYLKLNLTDEEKRRMYKAVKDSNLYDSKLSMYKVNASLKDASYELGRCTSFTPGWLENESIWLHMEYKYLLELLKSGMYEEYMDDFHNAVIPFLDEEVYGRSILENSSFIASSMNPNEKIHGKGFVARLSGSTIEFINMWKIMMFGLAPFEMKEELTCRFSPLIPDYLIGDDHKISAVFMGSMKVTYNLPDGESFYPGNYKIASITLKSSNRTAVTIQGGEIHGRLAEDVRNGMYESIEVNIIR